MSIMIFCWISKEVGFFVSYGVFFMLCIYFFLVVVCLDGEIVCDFVVGNGKVFFFGLVKWCGFGGFVFYINVMIKYFEFKVLIVFCICFICYIYDLYFNDNLNYYKFYNFDGGVG